MIILWWKIHEFLTTEFLFQMYRGVMWLKRRRNKLKGWRLVIAYVFAAFGLICDVLYNAVIGTIKFHEWPKEFTYTVRLRRYRFRTDWRYKEAVKIFKPFNKL